ncbi:hypothetical protein [Streptomyces viridochromogenes]|uniref:Uncharacterized protein n=1 Tax=Streptomyces viridochromogenes Tue57 TaxID=1160705 RepID=L8PJN1_STRVR|nr:hypothetical protein [Streptomyces viridochromogenes]ELS56459.1 hypothetical protein STVIR_2557 [Streptomyces viridochromogenes Tue57]
MLRGFVTPGDDCAWCLSRLVVSCCAPDVQVRKATIHGVKAPAANAWVLVTGAWRLTGEPGDLGAEPALDPVRVTKTAEPQDPYTDTAPDIARS